MKNIKALFALLVVVTALVACNSDVFDLNSGLKSGLPCEPPCWQNLTPGKSTSVDIDQFLETLDRDKWPERDERISPLGCKYISLRDQPGIEVNRIVNLYIYEKRLILIQSDINQTITLKAIAQKYGDPLFYRATNAIGLDGSEYYSVSVYYPDIGLKLDVDVKENVFGKILPTMKVDFAEYYPAGDIREYFSNKYTCWSELKEIEGAVNDELRYVQPWTGFGDIQVIETR